MNKLKRGNSGSRNSEASEAEGAAAPVSHPPVKISGEDWVCDDRVCDDGNHDDRGGCNQEDYDDCIVSSNHIIQWRSEVTIANMTIMVMVVAMKMIRHDCIVIAISTRS